VENSEVRIYSCIGNIPKNADWETLVPCYTPPLYRWSITFMVQHHTMQDKYLSMRMKDCRSQWNILAQLCFFFFTSEGGKTIPDKWFLKDIW